MKTFDSALRAAFEAGEAYGADNEAYAARGVGPHTHREPTFEEWRASLSGLEDDLGPLEIGDTVEVVTPDPTFEAIRGARLRVELFMPPGVGRTEKHVMLAAHGHLWAIPLSGVKKVRA
jgi:hypothetical protein